MEMGCETTPMLRACLLTRRSCVSFDIDKSIITDHYMSLLSVDLQGRTTTTFIGVDEITLLIVLASTLTTSEAK